MVTLWIPGGSQVGKHYSAEQWAAWDGERLMRLLCLSPAPRLQSSRFSFQTVAFGHQCFYSLSASCGEGLGRAAFAGTPAPVNVSFFDSMIEASIQFELL